MKIVILDAHVANPGDLSWAALEAFGELTVYDRTSPRDILKRAATAEIVLTNKTPLEAETIKALPCLKMIGVLATGYNVVDVHAAKRQGVAVCNVAAYSTDSVAQLVMGYILHFSSQIALHSALVHQGEWQKCADFSFCAQPLHELRGKVLGIYGYGTIGQKVAQLAAAFGMQVQAYRRDQSGDPSPAQWATPETIWATSDYITLHCPLTADTTALINSSTLALMKKSAVLINTSRGPVVDETALAEALHGGVIAGAAIDVMAKEPPADSPLFGLENCVITPHVAWATVEARQRLIEETRLNIEAFLQGTPRNVVNG